MEARGGRAQVAPASVATQGGRRSHLLWLVAGATSAVLLLAVLSQVEWRAVSELVADASLPLLAAALLGFLGEGLFTALRLARFAPRSVPLSRCLVATGWYVVLLVALPARLGELAGVGLLHRHLGMRPAAAATALLLQRILDLAVLCAVFVALLAVLATPLSGAGLLAVLSLLAGALLASARWLHLPLAWMARALRARPSPGAMRRTLLRVVLQARLYHRHRLTRATALGGTLLTLGKWTCHLTGFTLLLSALALPLSVPHMVAIGAAYNCLAVVPLQTVGGVGIGEAGLLGLLTMFGLAVPRAAGAAIVLRAVLIVAPVAFWAATTLTVRPSGPRVEPSTP